MSLDDIVQVQQLVCREREARDRQWWEVMRQTYSPKASINISWYQGSRDGFVEGSIRMARGGSSADHRLHPIVVRVNEDKTRAVATLSAVIGSRVVVDGVEADLESLTRLIYRTARTEEKLRSDDGVGAEGHWQLVGLDCIYQRDTLTAAVPGEQLAVDIDRLKGYRSSYRCLSYVLEAKGFPVDPDLPGDDRPAEVEQMYQHAFQWLRSV